MKLRVRDVCHGDRVGSRAIVLQQKTQRPVQFEITPSTREAVEAWIKAAALRPDDNLFPSRLHGSPHSGRSSTPRNRIPASPRDEALTTLRSIPSQGRRRGSAPRQVSRVIPALSQLTRVHRRTSSSADDGSLEQADSSSPLPGHRSNGDGDGQARTSTFGTRSSWPRELTHDGESLLARHDGRKFTT